jgi:hypothetical protein
MLTRGPNTGEYVACCALSKCGYVGKSARLQLVDQELNWTLVWPQSLHAVLLEQMHNSPGLPIKRYARRSELHLSCNG